MYKYILLRLPLDAAKGCQGTIYNYAPAEYDSTQLRSTRSLGQLSHRPCQENPTLLEGSRKSILPAWWQNRVAGHVHKFQPVWRGARKMHNEHWQHQLRGEILVLNLESAGLQVHLESWPVVCTEFIPVCTEYVLVCTMLLYGTDHDINWHTSANSLHIMSYYVRWHNMT